MTFLQPWLLWALPIAALPIVVHLLNLRRHKRVDWGAMQFLLQATRQRKGHTRLRHLLILASRVAAIAALVFVVSRPMAGRWFGLFSSKPETVIVVLDRSASMSQQDIQTGVSKRSMAVEQIATAVTRTGTPRNLVLIESSGQPPRVLGSPTALREIPETGATDAAADLPAMLQDALEYVVANKAGRTDIWVCSDLQATDWNEQGGRWNALRDGFRELKQPVRFHLLTYAEPPRGNVAVRIVKLRREADGDIDRLLMDIELSRQGGDITETFPLEVVVDGARSAVDVELAGDSMILANHAVPIDRDRERGWGKVELPNDVNPRDNVFFFTYGDSIVKRSIVVTDEPGTAWPLLLAAAPKTQDAEATIVSSHDLEMVPWSQVSLIQWQAPLPEGEAARHLEGFVASGGNVLFFPPPGESANALFGHAWQSWQQISPDDDAQSIDRWRDDSGILAHTDAGDPLPIAKVVVRDYRSIKGDGQVLARLKTEDPLVLRVPTNQGGVHFVTTLPQHPYSNLAREGIVFFALVQRALASGSERVLQNQFGEIGRNTQQSSDESATWQRIDGWLEGNLSTEARHVAGVYQAGEQLIARNRPVAEDRGGRLSRDQLATLFAGLNYRVVQDSVEGGRSLVTEIWRVFAMLILIALLVEAALCIPDVRPRKLVPA